MPSVALPRPFPALALLLGLGALGAGACSGDAAPAPAGEPASALPAAADGTAGEGDCAEEAVCSSQVIAMTEQATAASADPAAARPAGAAAPAASTGEETTYGAPLTLPAPTPISELLADWPAFEGKTVQVRGTVVEVCEHRGCWMDIAGSEDFQKLRFKVEDGEMVFPITAKGGTATAEGVVTKIVIPVEQLREVYAARAKEAGEKFDPSTITEARVVWQLQGTGARIGV